MSFRNMFLFAAAVACTGVPCLAEDKYDSSHPQQTTRNGAPVPSHQDFGYAPRGPAYHVPGPYPAPRPRLGRHFVPTVDYYHSNNYYPGYNAPYHEYGMPIPEADARVHSPYRFESQGGPLNRGYYPDHVNYTVGSQNWGSFFRTYTTGNNYPGPKPTIAY